MKRLLLLLGLLALPGTPRADSNDFTAVERGRYLATVGDCIACHTGPAGALAGGRSIETPFGAIVSPNLTPDPDTGLGRWSTEDFARAMHEGVSRTVGHLYPAFPYPWYTRTTREDVDAIYAFLRSVPPVRNAVDRDTLPFPFSIRASMRAWNLLYFSPGRFQPDPGRSAEWNRGAYLVEGLGHCGACHTARDVLGGDAVGAHLQGGVVQGWYAPNLTAERRQGLGNWPVEEIVAYLRTGHTARSAASGPMAEVVGYSTRLMTEADLRAMAVYLLDQPPRAPQPPAALAPADPQMRTGEALYVDNCMACHRRDGTGVDRLIPALAGSQVAQQPTPETLLRIVLSGVRSVATDAEPTGPGMPAFGWRLSDQQAADVVTYVRNAWGNAAPPATSDGARRMRALVVPAPAE